MRIGHNYYSTDVYTPANLRTRVKTAARVMRRFHKKTPFDAIAFRGSSGAALAFPLSVELEMPVIYVRKDSEYTDSHGKKVEGPDTDVARYVIVDDLIATGKTVHAIIDVIRAISDGAPSPQCVGIFLYSTSVGKGNLGDATSCVPGGLPVVSICACWMRTVVPGVSIKEGRI